MDAARFDRWSKRLGQRRLSRRAMATAGAGGIGAAFLATLSVAAARQATPSAGVGSRPSFLFVQTARAGTFKPNPQVTAATPATQATPVAGRPSSPVRRGQFVLTLTGHAGETVYFSDRPARVFGEAATGKFLAGLGFTPADPPNAALVAETAQGSDVLLVELMNPSYDEVTATLTYEADVARQYQGEGLKFQADQQQDETIAPEFSQASLFIDDCWNTIIDCLTPQGVLTCGPFANLKVGQCWHWDSLSCYPCQDPTDACNNAFPGTCCSGGSCNCTGWTMDEFDQSCTVGPG